jgi:hypothetical protein
MIFRSIRKRLKAFSILSSLILLLPAGADIHACWYGPEAEEQRYMLFNPDLAQDKSWWTFFYNSRTNYLDGQTRTDEDEQIIVAEWLKALKDDIDPVAAFECFFGSLSDSALEHNAAYKAIRKQKPFRDYFELARRSEAASSMADPWYDDLQNEVIAKKRDVILETLPGQVEAERDPFLKRKYAFQLTKLSFYADNHTLFNQTYKRYFAGTGQDVLYWWATHYKSVMLEREEKVDSANYVHALVFSHSTAKMYTSKQFFSTRRLDATLALARNDEERADILLLAEVINPGRSLQGITRIYALNPRHKHLPLLISREINKLEDWLATTKYANAPRSVRFEGEKWDDPILENWNRDFAYLHDVTRALQDMPTLAAYVPDQYNLTMSYLHMLEGNGTAAAGYLAAVKSGNAAVQYQVKVQQVVLMTLQENILDNAVQEKLGKLFVSLLDGRGRQFESEKMLYSLSSYLRYTFASKGNQALAGLFDNLAINKFCTTCRWFTFEYSMVTYLDRYASTADLQTLLNLYDKPNKNTLEAFLLKPYATPYYFYDLLATKYVREGKLTEAATALAKVPDDFWYSFSNASEMLDQDPFLDNAELVTGLSMDMYNKREILDKMIALEAEADQDPAKRAANYFLLGNAWFNFTDNSWFMISYGRGGYMTDAFFEQFDASAQQRAFTYYKRALETATETEMKAKITYMLAALCDEKSKKRYARAFEEYHESFFYRKRNCLTLSDLANS